MIRILYATFFLWALTAPPPCVFAERRAAKVKAIDKSRKVKPVERSSKIGLDDEEKKTKPADKGTIKAVKMVLDAPVESLTSEIIQGFLEVDPQSLPRKMRMAYTSRVLELKVLRHLGKKKKRGFIRRVSPDCQPDEGSKTTDLSLLPAAGFVRITEDEEDYVMRKTDCTEIDLVCEFSLQIGAKELKGGKTERMLFLHSKDPLLNLVGEYRAGHRGGQTNFFGRGMFKCKH